MKGDDQNIAAGLLVALLIAMGHLSILAAKPEGSALSCGGVTQALGSCLDFVTGRRPKPSPICCGSVQRLNAMARTIFDRRTVCGCVKEAAFRIGDMRDELMAALPGQCSVYLPYLFTRRTDCSRIQ